MRVLRDEATARFRRELLTRSEDVASTRLGAATVEIARTPAVHLAPPARRASAHRLVDRRPPATVVHGYDS